MSDKIKAVLPKIGPLLRRLTSSADNEVVSAAHLLLRVLAGAGLDIHALVDRIEHGGDEKLSATEMQQIYDQAYAKGHADGAEQGRRSAVIAAAMPMAMLDTSDSAPVSTATAGSRSRITARTTSTVFPGTGTVNSSIASLNS